MIDPLVGIFLHFFWGGGGWGGGGGKNTKYMQFHLFKILMNIDAKIMF